MLKGNSKIKGFSFGLTSGVITTLGMIVGLESATKSNMVIIAGILSIAIADSFSDALGMHISEESEQVHSAKEIWTATIYTFLAKFFFALLFIIPFVLFDTTNAVVASILFGLAVIGYYSKIIAEKEHKPVSPVIGEHLAISLIVIIATHFVGDIIRIFLG